MAYFRIQEEDRANAQWQAKLDKLREQGERRKRAGGRRAGRG
jgi:hypothetical protein